MGSDMSTRSDLITSIASTVSDYYMNDNILTLDDAHIETWINQFNASVQDPILEELDYVFKKSYFSKTDFEDYLTGMIKSKKLAGQNPCDFWKDVSFLDIQQGGKSQSEMNELFSDLLKNICGYDLDQCETSSNTFVYLDDVMFSGSRIRNDFRDWINNSSPQSAIVHVLLFAFHTGSQFYDDNKLKDMAKLANKNISFNWWRFYSLENRRTFSSTSDVLWPTAIPGDAAVTSHVNGMNYQPSLRTGQNTGSLSLFSSTAGRTLLEEEFLKAGVRIRNMCPNLHEICRPLGFTALETLGFGSTIVTYRNCPNTTPLVFWVSDPWYPLFVRKPNR